ncbi:uncharacterized protein LOC131589112 [Poecile atricapillus]|uniref:uncharacterized protein LOC131589112 n=1 Tax=Poecile atricapillus TaxID=48891 RepID=UPI00273A311A|nr:uncharacterized protein LOC131589112 [Poecile atricapillus]
MPQFFQNPSPGDPEGARSRERGLGRLGMLPGIHPRELIPQDTQNPSWDRPRFGVGAQIPGEAPDTRRGQGAALRGESRGWECWNWLLWEWLGAEALEEEGNPGSLQEFPELDPSGSPRIPRAGSLQEFPELDPSGSLGIPRAGSLQEFPELDPSGSLGIPRAGSLWFFGNSQSWIPPVLWEFPELDPSRNSQSWIPLAFQEFPELDPSGSLGIPRAGSLRFSRNSQSWIPLVLWEFPELDPSRNSQSWIPPVLWEFPELDPTRNSGMRSPETESTYTSPCIQPPKSSQIPGISTSSRPKSPFGRAGRLQVNPCGFKKSRESRGKEKEKEKLKMIRVSVALGYFSLPI